MLERTDESVIKHNIWSDLRICNNVNETSETTLYSCDQSNCAAFVKRLSNEFTGQCKNQNGHEESTNFKRHTLFSVCWKFKYFRRYSKLGFPIYNHVSYRKKREYRRQPWIENLIFTFFLWPRNLAEPSNLDDTFRVYSAATGYSFLSLNSFLCVRFGPPTSGYLQCYSGRAGTFKVLVHSNSYESFLLASVRYSVRVIQHFRRQGTPQRFQDILSPGNDLKLPRHPVVCERPNAFTTSCHLRMLQHFYDIPSFDCGEHCQCSSKVFVIITEILSKRQVYLVMASNDNVQEETFHNIVHETVDLQIQWYCASVFSLSNTSHWYFLECVSNQTTFNKTKNRITSNNKKFVSVIK